jgi:intracellular multiplication protein IcmC
MNFSINVDVLQNIASNLIPVQGMLSSTCYVLGILYAFKAVYSLKVYGEARTMMSSGASVKEPVINLLVAAVFLVIPQSLKVFLASMFGASNIMEYAPITTGNPTLTALFGNAQLGQSLTIIIQTVGYIAFIRGWILVARSSAHGQQPGGLGKGLMHVFGGILAINIVKTLQIVMNTLYG